MKHKILATHSDENSNVKEYVLFDATLIGEEGLNDFDQLMTRVVYYSWDEAGTIATDGMPANTAITDILRYLVSELYERDYEFNSNATDITQRKYIVIDFPSRRPSDGRCPGVGFTDDIEEFAKLTTEAILNVSRYKTNRSK